MFRFAATTALTLLLSSTLALAAGQTVNGLTKSQASQFKLQQIDQVHPLVDKYDSITNTVLKMKMTTYDLGGSTDVSNMKAVLLGSFVHNEMRKGGSLHLIAHVDSVLSVTREAAGVYKIIAQEWPVGANWPAPVSDFRLRKVAYTVYAADLTVELRKLEGVEEFGERHYTSSINVSRQVLD